MTLNNRCIHGILCLSRKACVWCSTHTTLECNTPIRRYWNLLKEVLSARELDAFVRRCRALLQAKDNAKAVGTARRGCRKEAAGDKRSQDLVRGEDKPGRRAPASSGSERIGNKGGRSRHDGHPKG